ncbi:hypothetical protein AMATHDRAFT_76772 [Amanita thiersii Skay4041]|uniref:Uncharacterized protein n=1 Tax=Amanita thiersii Skay4041 TaxID=703135 RepID=A0A2A9NKZ8_9AGAR|nr:hypothetical protein AMATHDRAFT_76772 [Amanita thiersii Skay4041]
MVVRAPVIQQAQVPAVGMQPQPTQLCDFCHQKPRFSNHQFCSKTCASQAATLCKQCMKKPKFATFDYCGKNCAALAKNSAAVQGMAAAAVAPVSVQQQQQQQSAAMASGPAVVPVSSTNASVTTTKIASPPKGFSPIQVAKMVAQHLPQVHGLMGTSNTSTTSTNATATTTATTPAPPAPQAIPAAPPSQSAASGNPFLTITSQQQQQLQQQQQQQQIPASNTSSANSSNTAQLSAGTHPPIAPTLCLIPGCGKPVHVDAQGLFPSSYCSKKHREEAVRLGLVDPCIMCLTKPQSDLDYFCGKACREESMKKL